MYLLDINCFIVFPAKAGIQKNGQFNIKRNYWSPVAKSAAVGFCYSQKHRQNVGWSAEGGETQQSLE